VVLALAILALGRTHQSNAPKGRCYVRDAATTVKIAEAVLIPVYSEKQIASERPFRATLQE